MSSYWQAYVGQKVRPLVPHREGPASYGPPPCALDAGTALRGRIPPRLDILLLVCLAMIRIISSFPLTGILDLLVYVSYR